MQLDNHFGHLLQSHRKGKKMSQNELAERTDLDRTYISMLERGKRYPSLETVIKVSHALELKASDVIRVVEDNIESCSITRQAVSRSH